jgi:hypothetical protein
MAPPKKSPDEQHLEALSICHYILGGLHLLSGCVGVPIIALGNSGLLTRFKDSPSDPGEFLGPFLVLVGVGVILISWGQGILQIISGRKLALRHGRTFSIVVAAISCVNMPLGTVLGIFTLVVLSRPSVQALYLPAPSLLPTAAP